MKSVQLYTDGACKGNPGPGGYGVILRYGNREKEISGGDSATTNNRMELMAAIIGLEALTEPCEVTLYSDSSYLFYEITNRWVYIFKNNGWIKSDKKEALNIDLWERLLPLLEKNKVTLVWVRGHDGHEFNERCDKLAVAQAEKFSVVRK